MKLTQFKIEPSEKISLRLRARDKELLTRKAFSKVKSDYVSRLGRDSDSSHLVALYTPEELDDMLGCISLAVSNTKTLKLQRELESLYDHVSRIMAHHDNSLCQDPLS